MEKFPSPDPLSIDLNVGDFPLHFEKSDLEGGSSHPKSSCDLLGDGGRKFLAGSPHPRRLLGALEIWFLSSSGFTFFLLSAVVCGRNRKLVRYVWESAETPTARQRQKNVSLLGAYYTSTFTFRRERLTCSSSFLKTFQIEQAALLAGRKSEAFFGRRNLPRIEHLARKSDVPRTCDNTNQGQSKLFSRAASHNT